MPNKMRKWLVRCAVKAFNAPFATKMQNYYVMALNQQQAFEQAEKHAGIEGFSVEWIIPADSDQQNILSALPKGNPAYD